MFERHASDQADTQCVRSRLEAPGWMDYLQYTWGQLRNKRME